MKENTFDPLAFQRLKSAEKNHFWFRVRRTWIFDKINKFIPPPATLLEVGCGTGNVCSFLATQGYDATGCEFYQEAIVLSWPGFKSVRADANKLPFENKSFDIVGLFDVIEHLKDDVTPLREACRVVKDSGIIVITVPAREELWSYIDERAFHKRRYSKKSLGEVIEKAYLNPLSIEYFFMSLYLPMKWTRRKKTKTDNQFLISRYTNFLLEKYFSAERQISKLMPLPVGTSLIAVASKRRDDKARQAP
jgi:SAM-dependent methyltransferase